MPYRNLLLLLFALSMNALGMDSERTNSVPHDVLPLFSLASYMVPYDSVNIGYTVANTTFEDTLEIDVLNRPKEVFPLMVLGEVLGFNGFIWAWDRYVLDKGYARTGPSYWKRNFGNGTIITGLSTFTGILIRGRLITTLLVVRVMDSTGAFCMRHWEVIRGKCLPKRNTLPLTI